MVPTQSDGAEICNGPSIACGTADPDMSNEDDDFPEISDNLQTHDMRVEIYTMIDSNLQSIFATPEQMLETLNKMVSGKRQVPPTGRVETAPVRLPSPTRDVRVSKDRCALEEVHVSVRTNTCKRK